MGGQAGQPHHPNPLSRGISPLNFPGAKNPLGKIATQTALKGGVMAFLASNPWVWAGLVVILLFVFTFIIVVSGVAPGAPSQAEDTTTEIPAL